MAPAAPGARERGWQGLPPQGGCPWGPPPLLSSCPRQTHGAAATGPGAQLSHLSSLEWQRGQEAAPAAGGRAVWQRERERAYVHAEVVCVHTGVSESPCCPERAP